MTAFDFPANPSLNQKYAPVDGPVYRWDGSVWKATSQGVPLSAYSEPVPPLEPFEDQVWFNTTNNQINVYQPPNWVGAGIVEPANDTQTHVRKYGAWQAGALSSKTGYTVTTDSDGSAPKLFTFGENGGFTIPGGLSLSPATESAVLYMNAPVGMYGLTYYMRAGKIRWHATMDATSELGSNSGSDFEMSRYNDAGAWLGSVMQIHRASGTVTIPLLSNGGALHTSFSGAPISNLVPGTATGALIEAPVGGQFVIGIRNNDTNDSFSVVSHGGVAAAPYSKLAFRVNAMGDTTAAGNFANFGNYSQVLPGVGAAIYVAKSTNADSLLVLDKGANGASSYLDGRFSDRLRWRLNMGDWGAENTVNNAGSDFHLSCYANDGATYIGTPIQATRSNGYVTINHGLQVHNGLTSAVIASNTIYAYTNNIFLRLSGGSPDNNGANIELYGNAHATLANRIYIDASMHIWRDAAGTSTGQMEFTPGILKVAAVTTTGTMKCAALECTGRVTSSQTFCGSGDVAILGTSDLEGIAYIRPRGVGESSKQTVFYPSGEILCNILHPTGSLYAGATGPGASDIGNGYILSTPGYLHLKRTGTSSQGMIIFMNNAAVNPVQVGSITTSGSNTVYNPTSDERLKTFIGRLDPLKAIATIRRDPAREYTWDVDGAYGVGWGAQTSHKIDPYLANPPEYEEDEQENKNKQPGESGFKPWGIDPNRRTPYLWAGLGWALDRIDELMADVAALKGLKGKKK